MQNGFGFADIDGESGLPVGLVAFGSLADELSRYRKGDSLRVSGTFKANDYTNKAGDEVQGYQIVLDGIAGVKAARASFSVPKQATQASAEFQDSALPDRF